MYITWSVPFFRRNRPVYRDSALEMAISGTKQITIWCFDLVSLDTLYNLP